MSVTTLDEVRSLIGSYCDFRWTEPDGREGGMEGELVSVEQDVDGMWWAVVDYGYGAAVGHFTIRETTESAGGT